MKENPLLKKTDSLWDKNLEVGTRPMVSVGGDQCFALCDVIRGTEELALAQLSEVEQANPVNRNDFSLRRTM